MTNVNPKWNHANGKTEQATLRETISAGVNATSLLEHLKHLAAMPGRGAQDHTPLHAGASLSRDLTKTQASCAMSRRAHRLSTVPPAPKGLVWRRYHLIVFDVSSHGYSPTLCSKCNFSTTPLQWRSHLDCIPMSCSLLPMHSDVTQCKANLLLPATLQSQKMFSQWSFTISSLFVFFKYREKLVS